MPSPHPVQTADTKHIIRLPLDLLARSLSNRPLTVKSRATLVTLLVNSDSLELVESCIGTSTGCLAVEPPRTIAKLDPV